MSVRIQGMPTGLSPAVNRVVLAHLQDKPAHSYIATELAAAVKPLGGKVRPAASLSAPVHGGEDTASLADQTHQLLTQGYRHVQVQPAAPSVKGIVTALESLREKFGPGVELLHRAPASFPKEKAGDGSSIWKIPWRPRTHIRLRISAGKPPRRSRWEKRVSNRTSGCRSSQVVGSISSACAFPPSAA